MLSMSAACRRGFTLIELMIVIIVIAILALIVIPKLASASRRAKESSMQSNLQTLRNALEQFNADCGQYPNALADLASATAPTYVPYGTFRGPYLRAQGGIGGGSIPGNPLVDNTLPAETTAAPTSTPAAAWFYAAGSGNVQPGLTGATVDGGVAYTAL